MTFFCLGNDSFDKHACYIIVALYWALVYITIFDITASLYLLNSTSQSFKEPSTDKNGKTTYHEYDKNSIRSTLKMVGVFNILLISTIVLTCIKVYTEIMD